MPDSAAVNGEPRPRSEELRVMELELRRENEQLRALIENTSDIISIINEDGTIRYESPSIERILGYRPEDLIGKNVLDFVHPDDIAATVGTLKAALWQCRCSAVDRTALSAPRRLVARHRGYRQAPHESARY